MEFWFDFGSSYSYLTSTRIERVCTEWGIRLVWQPFLLGPIFKEKGWNTSPFNLDLDRGRYMWREMERYAKAYGIQNYRKPSVFPRNGLLAARIATAASNEPWIGPFISAVFRTNFEQDRDISDKAEMNSILQDLEVNGSEWLKRAELSETKLKLRERTEHARRLGIFGAPTFLVASEIFWGNDRLEQACQSLSDHCKGGRSEE